MSHDGRARGRKEWPQQGLGWILLAPLALLFAGPLVSVAATAVRGALPEQQAATSAVEVIVAGLKGIKRRIAEEPPGLHYLKDIHDAARIRLLRSSPNPKVVVGHARDWLYFLGPDIGLPTYTHHRPFTAAESAHWQRFIRQRVAWFEARGITYALVMVPSKSSIHPEHIPPRIARRPIAGRFDQIVSGLPPAERAHVVDLRPILQAQARHVQNYYRLDSHWNDTGAYLGYRHLIRRLQVLSRRSERPLPRRWAQPVAVRAKRVDSPRGDLVAMLNHPRFLTERTMALVPRGTAPRRVAVDMQRLTRLADPKLDPSSKFYPYALEQDGSTGELPSCVAFRDSMFHMVEPYLARHCRRMVLLKHHDKVGVPALELDASFLAAERPDLVIEQFVERLLTRPHNRPPRLLGEAEARAFPPPYRVHRSGP